MADYSYIGKGQVYLAPITNNVAGALMPIGNVSKLSLSVSEDTKELLDYTSPGGGTQNKIIRIKGIEASITAHDISVDNLAIALRGTASAITTAVVTSEAHTVTAIGELIATEFLPVTTGTITVKNSAGDVTYVKDTDYSINRLGIVILSAGMVSAGSCKITYTKVVAHALEALVSAGIDYKLVFSGLNEARSGKAVSVTFYRTKFSPTSGLDLISDDFGKLEMKASLLQDSTIVGTGLSQYIKVILED